MFLCICYVHDFYNRLNYLDKQLASVPPIQRNADEWQALFTYRNSLVQGEHEIHPITLKQAQQKRYGKRKNITNIDGKMWLFTCMKLSAHLTQFINTILE